MESSSLIAAIPGNEDTTTSTTSIADVDHRFVGDLNPESAFLSSNSPPDQSNVGFWIRNLQTGATERHFSRIPLQQPRSAAFRDLDPTIHTVVLPYIEAWCLSMIPKPEQCTALYQIYVERIHPIIPILDKQEYDSMDPADPATILLKQGICLAASKHHCAKDHLSFQHSFDKQNHEQFGKSLSYAMRMSLDLGLVMDKKILVQAVCLLYIFLQGTEHNDLSAETCSRAIHHALTIGVHISDSNLPDQHSEQLFCSVWALDILNAAFHGRPVLMHARDFGRDLNASIERQRPIFQLFLRNVKLLEEVIGLYRPASFEFGPVPEIRIPSFEELVILSGDVRMDSNLLGKHDLSSSTSPSIPCLLTTRQN